ncbi:alpha/beta hydrolase [Frankia nepalensis]|uniref:alpha/beta hydrolase n=1 Tax=Frankia nepalensis TaxID=1836974 RepID=UPI0027DC2800|nr:alpha/beta hydrolase [Frankia nepalensis]
MSGSPVKWSWRARLSSALALSSLSVAGLAGPAEAAAPTLATSPAMGGLSAWTACGDGLECAKLPVPLDHAHPAAGTIELALIRRPAADPARRIGSLVYLEGGPGVSGVDTIRTSPDLFDEPVRDRFDIVGFDQRGVGQSAPVHCLTDEEKAAYLASVAHPRAVSVAPSRSGSLAAARAPATGAADDEDLPAGFDETVEAYRQIVAGCERLSGPLLPYLSTEAAARDLDLLRAALGEPRLTAYGASYGTELGVTYAALFPTRLRALVLEAVLDPAQWTNDPLGHVRLQAIAFDAALDAFFASCARDPECGFGHGDPAGAYDRLMARLAEKPIYARGKEVDTTTPVDASVAISAVLELLYSEQLWPILALGLELADDYDDGSVLLATQEESSGERDDGTFDNSFDAQIAIDCADQNYPTDLAVYRRFAADLAREAPRFGPVLALGSVTCAFWPTPSASRYTGPFQAPGAPPILLLGTTGDPATPYQEALSTAAQLGDRAVLLTWRSYTHGAYADSSCVREATDRYLIDLITPRPGTVCDD